MLFSADFVPVNIDAGVPAAEIEVVSTPVEVTADTAAERSPDAHRTELLIIDSQVPDYDKLLEAFLAANPGQDFEIHLLDGATKGIDGLGEIITSYTQVDAVHIISHGADGSVILGDSLIDQDTLTASAGELDSWQDHLTESADILFYGCNLAATSQGEAFVSTFAELSGADVAASDDLTGSAALGGDWELEVTTGSIEALTLTAGKPESWDAVLATQLTPTGEMQVNTSTGGAQETSAQTLGSKDAVAMDSAGNYVVVWSDSVTDGSGYGIFAQRFDATGAKVGSEFQINQTITDNQYWASVAMADDGRFVVSWTSVNQDGTPASVYARQFNADGSAFGNEFRANSTTSGTQTNADVAMVRSGVNAGDFVIVWQGNGSGDSDGIFGQRYAADGSTAGGEFMVNTTTSGLQENPAVAINDNGEFSVVWEDAENIFLEFFDSASNSQGLEKQINTGSNILFTVNNSIRPDLVLDNSGLSSVVWRSENSAADGVYLRQVDKTGNLQGFSATGVSASSNPDSTSPSIARDASGNFFVTYQKSGDGDQWGIYGRGYDASLSALSDEFLINQSTSGVQQSPSVALLDLDNFVVVWSGNGNGDSDGVFARQHSFPYQITVNTTNDTADGDTSSIANLKLDPGADGAISLREAITAANNGTHSQDTIQFDITGAGPHIINLGSALPTISDTMVLDGSTEPDYSGSPVVEINGSAAGNVNGLTLDNSAGNSSIKGLALTGFTGATNGIAISLDGADAVTLQGNYIGVKPDGSTVAGNRIGIDIGNNAERNIVGGINAGEGNLIRGNTDGLIIAETSSTRNSVRGNAIYGNSESNFALSNTDTVTPNDADDSDSGPNNLQNYPVLSTAAISGTDLTVTGTLTSSANTPLTLDFYAASSQISAVGYPEAERYLGTTSVTTGDNGDGSGNAALNEFLSAANVVNGEYITVIATDGSDNSSEMALSVAATGGNSAPTAAIAALADINEGDALTLDASASSDPDSDPLTYRWDLNNDGTYGDVTGVNPTVDWATLKTFGIDDNGSYSIGLQVNDGNGGVATTNTSLTVNNTAPTLSVSGATTVTSGIDYTLNLAATDPGNDTISSWTINWGDGSIETVNGNPSSVTHTYSNTGFTNNISVAARDEDSSVDASYIDNDLFAGRYVNNAGIYRIQGNWGNAPVEFANEGTLDKAIQPVIGPDGYIYVSGESSKNVLRYNAADGSFVDVFTTLSGNAGGLAFGPDGNLYVSNYSAKTIEKFDASDGTSLGSFVSSISGNPYSLTFGPDGNLYVNLYNTAEVLKYNGSTGAAMGTFVSAHAGGLGTPEQMIFGPDGNLYIADVANNSVLRYDGSNGNYLDTLIAASEPNLDQPNGLAFGPDGNLYVSDAQDGDILRYNGTTGTFIDVYASGLNTPSLLGFAPDLQVTVLEPRQVAVAADSSGNYVIVEESYTGTDIDLVAQRYDASGNIVGTTININTTAANNQFDPDVAMDANGNFVVVWSSEVGSGDTNIIYRVFDNTGAPVTSELLANTTTAGAQQFAAVAYGGDGKFIITWSSQGQDDGGNATGWGVYAQRFNGDGSLVGGEFLVNTTTAGDQKFSDVAADDYGDFVIAWQSDGQDGDGWGIYSKAWRETGNLLHDEILRNTWTVGDQHDVTVAMEADGDYTLAWVSDGQDGDAGGIYADNVAWGGSGTNTAGEFRISSTTAGNQYDPEIASDPVGNFIVSWTSTGQDGDGATETNVYGQIYKMKNSGPVIVGSEFILNTSYSNGSQRLPAVAAVDTGTVIAAWSGETAPGTQGVSHRIMTNALQNEVPSVSLANPALSYVEGNPPLAIDAALSVTDPDSANLAGATVLFRDGFAAGEDQLWFTDQLGISGSYDAVNGVLTLTGTASVADYQTALRTVTYSNSSNAPSTVQRTIEINVNDGTASSSDTRKLSVTATNDAPVIDDLMPAIAENTGTLSISATDPEGDAITGFNLTGGADAALFTLDSASGVLSFNNPPDFEAPVDANGDNVYEVEITTSDNQGASLAQAVSISISNVDEPPTATNLGAAETYVEDTPLNLTDIVVSDVDSTVTVTLTLSDTAAGSLNTGTSGVVTSTFSGSVWTASGAVADVNALLTGLTFTPATDYNSGFSMATSVDDGFNPTITGTKVISVNPIGDTPVVASVTTDEDAQSGAIIIDRNASDGPEVTHFKISGISNGTLYLNDDTTIINNGDFITYAQGQAGLEFTPAQDSVAAGSFDVEASQDGTTVAAQSGKATSTITVNAVNDAPSFTTLGNQTVANDSGAHTVAGFASAAAGGGADESSQTFSYAVSNNNAALFSVGPAIDANGQLTFTVANGQFGTATVTVSVSDSGGTVNGGIDTSAAQTFDITIQANTAPTISAIANQTIDEDGSPPALAFSVSDAETVAGSLVVSASSGNTALIPNGNLVLTDSSSGNWTIQATPVANQAGSATITVAVSDGTLTTNETFVVTVNPVGDTPAVASISTDEDTQSGPIVIDRSASDGTEVTHFKISGISNGTLYLNDGVTLVNDGDFITVAQGQAGLKFTPALNSTAAGSFDVEASEDGATVAAQSGKATSTISVTPVNDAPQISLPPAQSVNEDQPLGISGISISDIDDNTAQLQLTAASGKITVTPVGSALITSGGNHSADLTLSGSIADINATLNSLHYQGNPNFNGTDTLTISMTDSEGLTTESALAITVTPVPDAPEIQIAEQTTDSGERVAVITIEKSTLDGDEQAITHFRIDTVAAGTLFLANDEPLQSGDFITAAQARAGLIFKGDTQVLGDNGILVISPAISDVNGEPVVPEGAEPSSVSPPIFPPDELSLNLKSAETVETFNESSFSDNNQTDDSDENQIQLLRNAPAVVTITKEFEQQVAALAIDLKPVQDPAKRVEGYREVAGDFVSFEPVGKQPAKSPGYAFLVNNMIHANELQKETLYTLSYEQMFFGMDQVRDELLQLDSNQQFILGSTAVASAGLSAGYVLWLLRSGLLISSVMASLPAWTFADPLPVLTSRASEDEDDDESLEDIIEKSEKKRKRPPAAAVEPETGV